MDIVLGKKTWTLREKIGALATNDKTAATNTFFVQRPGFNGGTTVSSQTTIHDNLIIVTGTGEEVPLHLRDVNLTARPGNVLHTVWMAPQGADSFTLVALYNRATGDEIWLQQNLTRIFRLTEPLWKGLVVAFILSLCVLGLLSLFLPLPATLVILLSFVLPFLTWKNNKDGKAAIAKLKSVVGEGFRARREEELVRS